MTRPCTRCGDSFAAKAAWMRLCWDCWRADRDAVIDEAAYLRGYNAGAADAMPEVEVALLREAIKLTHPDRHPRERADQANRVTARLLEMLDRQRVAA